MGTRILEWEHEYSNGNMNTRTFLALRLTKVAAGWKEGLTFCHIPLILLIRVEASEGASAICCGRAPHESTHEWVDLVPAVAPSTRIPLFSWCLVGDTRAFRRLLRRTQGRPWSRCQLDRLPQTVPAPKKDLSLSLESGWSAAIPGRQKEQSAHRM